MMLFQCSHKLLVAHSLAAGLLPNAIQISKSCFNSVIFIVSAPGLSSIQVHNSKEGSGEILKICCLSCLFYQVNNNLISTI